MLHPLFLLVLFIAVPLVELALLIQLGNYVGVLATIGIVIATAVIGTALLRSQGFAVLARASDALQAGKAPVEPVVEGLFLLIAGAFLLTPGLLTDTVGFLLLVPPIRRAVASWAIKKALASGMVRVRTFTTGQDGPGQTPHQETFSDETVGKRGGEDRFRPSDRRRGKPAKGPTVIEGDYERVDERPRGRNGA